MNDHKLVMMFILFLFSKHEKDAIFNENMLEIFLRFSRMHEIFFKGAINLKYLRFVFIFLKL
jgi:hypothetical protein